VLLGIVPALAILHVTAPPTAVQQQAIPAIEAKEYVGRKVTLEGTVGGVRVAKNGTVFIDLEKKAPHQAISAVIFPAAVGRFPELKALIGKRVLISGLVTRGPRGIEMILDQPSQLTAAREPNRVPCGSDP
jgi:hypothetical protein